MPLKKIKLDFWRFKNLGNELTEFFENLVHVSQGSRCLRYINEQSILGGLISNEILSEVRSILELEFLYIMAL